MGDINISYNAIVIPFEGLYSNDALDSGGETVLGLTRKYEPDWDGWAIVDACKKKPNFPNNLKTTNINDLAIKRYKTSYWDKLKLDQINDQKICTELFDISINQGSGTAAKYLQRALNLLNRNGKRYKDTDVDGDIGEETIGLVNSNPYPQDILLLLNVFQGYRYITICEKDKSQEEFMVGWLKRVSLP